MLIGDTFQTPLPQFDLLAGAGKFRRELTAINANFREYHANFRQLSHPCTLAREINQYLTACALSPGTSCLRSTRIFRALPSSGSLEPADHSK
jgi:hypothetical protein